ncbi:hypothetical protein [Actinoplanes xinjiangensis]|uniref:hypothetical protein n=1 Tax=Actinoplanes xinjiangensis TaxID=512350 RepID=UPI00341948C8
MPWEDPKQSESSLTMPLVFTTPLHTAINRSTFANRAWRPALSRAGIKSTRATGMHALRHYFDSVVLDKRQSVKAVAEYLGRSNPAFTLRACTHKLPISADRAREAYDDLFGGEDGSCVPAAAQDAD